MPLLGQLQFINLVVVLVRLYWFKNKFNDIGTCYTTPFPSLLIATFTLDSVIQEA
jgi:hypothetical protein